MVASTSYEAGYGKHEVSASVLPLRSGDTDLVGLAAD